MPVTSSWKPTKASAFRTPGFSSGRFVATVTNSKSRPLYIRHVVCRSGISNSVEVSTHFGIKVVTSQADMTVTDPVSGNPVYVLYSNPPGNIINAGDGNDHVVAGIGEDQIDGGAGIDVVSYARSNAAVKVDLATGKGEGGYAQGDTYANVEGAVGSNYDDVLKGNDADNTLSGGKGADTIDGAGGIDTVDYTHALDGEKDGKDGGFGQLVGAGLLGNHRRLGEAG